jgi:hypothetical protein
MYSFRDSGENTTEPRSLCICVLRKDQRIFNIHVWNNTYWDNLLGQKTLEPEDYHRYYNYGHENSK